MVIIVPCYIRKPKSQKRADGDAAQLSAGPKKDTRKRIHVTVRAFRTSENIHEKSMPA